MQELLGRIVTAAWMAPDNERLVFDTDQGRLAYRTEGDCCSYSFFNDIIGLDNLLGHEVTAVDSVDLDDIPNDGYDSIAAYGLKLTTHRGYVDIVFRNVSNGYYGGWCSLDPDTTVPADYLQLLVSDWSRDA